MVAGVVAFWLLLGIAALRGGSDRAGQAGLIFPAGALGGLALAVIGFLGLGAPAETAVLALGLPDLPFHLRLDALSAFFLLLLGAASAGVSLHAGGYFQRGGGGDIRLLGLQYHLFLASMVTVLVADDAYLFMVAWESMALCSYFLVTTDHRIAEIRSAGLLYLVVAHLGAIALLLCFGVLRGEAGDFTFAAMRGAVPAGGWAAAAFLLALAGFGAKAGFVPLHAWLPEAHPAAPSPVSALMSGVMLKTALYGLLRVGFDLLQAPAPWWGTTQLALGLATALFGALFAAVQTDMKRLLAYSSIENMGILLAGSGLALLARAYHMDALALLALTATLFHALNHALYKSLLFLATGSVMHATHQRGLGHLGGLIRSMPVVAALALVGALASAGLPPLNGFASEWLLLQAFLQTPGLPDGYLNMLVPVATAALALAVALAGYVMVKFFGVVFLGRPREAHLHEARDPGLAERLGMGWLALWCVVLGVAPVLAAAPLRTLVAALLGQRAAATPLDAIYLVALSPQRASYAPALFLGGIAGTCLLCVLLVRRLYGARTRRGPAWDCGFPDQDARMQDSAEGFSQPVKQVFAPVFRIEREAPSPFDAHPAYRSRVSDHLWALCYQPVIDLNAWAARQAGRLQHGRVAGYLGYSFATLLALLLLLQ